MKVLLLNGSPRVGGNTEIALNEIIKTLNGEGIETELIQVGNKPFRGCMACGGCRREGKCVFDDGVNEIVEKFALANQLQRSVISVPSNIAEGLSRSAVKEQCHFLDIAFGSLMEVDCQLEIARDLKYITEEQYSRTYKDIYDISKMLIRLKSVRQTQSSKKQTDIR